MQKTKPGSKAKKAVSKVRQIKRVIKKAQAAKIATHQVCSKESGLEKCAIPRTCIATRDEESQANLLRFTTTPDNHVVPDFKKKLPGKGIYVTNSKTALEVAIKKHKFGKNIKTDNNLLELVENLLKNRSLEAINLAKKAGVLVTGLEKVKENIKKGKVAYLLMAVDAGADGRKKIETSAGMRLTEKSDFNKADKSCLEKISSNEDTNSNRQQPIKNEFRSKPIEILTVFSIKELDEALNKVNTVHAALLKSEMANMVYNQINRWQNFINS